MSRNIITFFCFGNMTNCYNDKYLKDFSWEFKTSLCWEHKYKQHLCWEHKYLYHPCHYDLPHQQILDFFGMKNLVKAVLESSGICSGSSYLVLALTPCQVLALPPRSILSKLLDRAVCQRNFKNARIEINLHMFPSQYIRQCKIIIVCQNLLFINNAQKKCTEQS